MEQTQRKSFLTRPIFVIAFIIIIGATNFFLFFSLDIRNLYNQTSQIINNTSVFSNSESPIGIIPKTKKNLSLTDSAYFNEWVAAQSKEKYPIFSPVVFESIKCENWANTEFTDKFWLFNFQVLRGSQMLTPEKRAPVQVIQTFKPAYLADKNPEQSIFGVESALVHTHPNSKQKICSSNSIKSARQFICGDRDSPVYFQPWCLDPDNPPAAILTTTCAMVFSSTFTDHSDVTGEIITESAIINTRHMYISSNKAKNTPIDRMDKLATPGIMAYMAAYGHFPHEHLPRLLRLDQSVPEDVPLLWPESSFTKGIYQDLKDLNIIKSNRPILWYSQNHNTLHAKQLYFYHSFNDGSNYPYVSIQDLQYLNQLITSSFEKPVKAKPKILVLRREGGARSVSNHDQLITSLSQRFGNKMDVETFVIKNMKWIDIGRKIYEADVIIGPHGANLANWIFLRKGRALVIEIGFLDAGFDFPIEYHCIARALYCKYYLSIANGSYGSSLTAEVDEIVDIVARHEALLYRSLTE